MSRHAVIPGPSSLASVTEPGIHRLQANNEIRGHFRSKREQRGFTLMEVLVAIAIIAVVAVAVAIGIAGMGGSRNLEREAERLVDRMRYACEFSALRGTPVGLLQQQEGYRFVSRGPAAWQAIEQPVLAAHSLTPIRLALRRDGRLLETDGDDLEQLNAPDVVCFPSGELTPFEAELGLANTDTVYRVTGHADGRIELRDVPPAP